MQWKTPKNTDKYQWTTHVTEKMHYYGLSEQKVLGVIRSPKRIETGIVENTVAVMLPVGNIKKGNETKPAFAKASAWQRWGRPVFAPADAHAIAGKPEDTWNQEIWVMYQLKSQNKKFKAKSKIENPKLRELEKRINANNKITIISAWRYPGVSPKNNPIPEEIIREIEEIM
jgi:hypothetical protein